MGFTTDYGDYTDSFHPNWNATLFTLNLTNYANQFSRKTLHKLAQPIPYS